MLRLSKGRYIINCEDYMLFPIYLLSLIIFKKHWNDDWKKWWGCWFEKSD